MAARAAPRLPEATPGIAASSTEVGLARVAPAKTLAPATPTTRVPLVGGAITKPRPATRAPSVSATTTTRAKAKARIGLGLLDSLFCSNGRTP